MRRIICFILALGVLFLFACSSVPANQTNSKSGEVNASTVTKTKSFHNGVAWVKCSSGNNAFTALIDENGKTLFTDIDGLKDSSGKTYRIRCQFDSVNGTYDFSEQLGFEYSDTQDAWQFNNEHSLVVCENDDGWYLCLLDMTGCVKDAIELNLRILAESTVTAYHNGNGTYYVKWDDREFFYSIQSGIITLEENARFSAPVRGGYFTYQILEENFSTCKTTYYLIDGQKKAVSSHALNTKRADDAYTFFFSEKQYNLFLNENVACKAIDGGFSYAYNFINCYNISTKQAFDMPHLYGDIVNPYGDKRIFSFSYDNDSTCYYNIYQKNPENNDYTTIIEIFKIDENGNKSTVYTHALLNRNQFVDLGQTDKYVLLYMDDALHLISLENGIDKRVLSDYTDRLNLVSDAYCLTNTLLSARMRGQDGEDYITIVEHDGDVIVPLEKNGEGIYAIGNNSGILYHSQEEATQAIVVLNSGTKKTFDTTQYENELKHLKEVGTNGLIKFSNNYLCQNGEFLFKN